MFLKNLKTIAILVIMPDNTVVIGSQWEIYSFAKQMLIEIFHTSIVHTSIYYFSYIYANRTLSVSLHSPENLSTLIVPSHCYFWAPSILLVPKNRWKHESTTRKVHTVTGIKGAWLPTRKRAFCKGQSLEPNHCSCSLCLCPDTRTHAENYQCELLI